MGQRIDGKAPRATGVDPKIRAEARGSDPNRRRGAQFAGRGPTGPHVHAGASLLRERVHVRGLLHQLAEARAPVPGYPAGVQLPHEGGSPNPDLGVLPESEHGPLRSEHSSRLSVSRSGDPREETEPLRVEGGPDWGGARITGQ